uniref:Uncharacterized protein n=1 Tax=Hucho hucho TaxID=62062 RepID=A0A4W5NIZ8_9TELE
VYGRVKKRSGWVMSCRREQALVVTELAPEHHSREKSHGSFTTHRFTDTFLFRSSLAHGNTQKHKFSREGTLWFPAVFFSCSERWETEQNGSV